MVFLVEDFVNLPADQIANIWLAAHMKRKLNKKDIKKTKLASACSQLHSNKTKKPMQLRHYGQCLIGISWIHYKQVEYLHNDCNEAFSKARLVLIRKRNVDLAPSKGRARDITLPEQKDNNDNIEIMDIDLNAANNLSQLYLDDDNVSDVASLLGTVSHSGRGDLALDAEITMQQNELSTIISPNRSIRDRRSSFGGISSLLMGDMDIEIKFDDDDDEDGEQNGSEILDESQAQKANIDAFSSLTDVDDDAASVERARGQHDTLLFEEHENMSEVHAVAQPDVMSVTDAGSHVSFEKENANHHVLDDVSAHSGSVVTGNAMDIDIIEDDGQHSMHSIHVGLDNVSIDGGASVATTDLKAQEAQTEQKEQERDTPPPPSPTARNKGGKNAQKKKKRKKKKKKKKKKRFEMDKKIELDRDELRARDMDRAEFVYPAGRDALHIWREFPLSTLEFDELLYQPLSKQHFGTLPHDIATRFAMCNKAHYAVSKEQSMDELGDINILREEDAEIEQARDEEDEHERMDHDINDLPLPMNDNLNILNAPMESEADAMEIHKEKEAGLEWKAAEDDDNASTLDSVVNDAIPAPNDPLFEAQALEMNEEIDAYGDENTEEEDDDIDLNAMDRNKEHLSFDTNDENILTQMDPHEMGMGFGAAMKPRDWSRRARKTFSFFKRKEGREFSFNELMTPQTKRDTVVGVFYELLVFKNSELVDLKQEEPFGDITIIKTDNFYRHEKMSQRLSQRV